MAYMHSLIGVAMISSIGIAAISALLVVIYMGLPKTAKITIRAKVEVNYYITLRRLHAYYDLLDERRMARYGQVHDTI